MKSLFSFFCQVSIVLFLQLGNVNAQCPNIGDLVITEIMQNPSAVTDGNGEWIEIHNTTATAIDLNGMMLSDDGSNSHIINSSVIVLANGYVVLGRNANMTMNGGVNLDYQYSSFTLGNGADQVILTCMGTIIDEVKYDGGPNFPDPTGASMSLNPNNLNTIDNDDGSNWCESTSTFGAGDLGTPGAANDACLSLCNRAQ